MTLSSRIARKRCRWRQERRQRTRLQRAPALVQRTSLALAILIGGCAHDSGDDDDDAGSCTDELGEVSWWRPTPGTTWQWQLTGAIDTSFDVEMYDIDLFDVSAAQIGQLHDQGRIVVCYFSAGSFEEWRPDAAMFPDAALGEPLDGWPGERWLDVRSDAVRSIMQARLDLAVSKGCDAVEPDNVDGYANDSGFALKAQDQREFNIFLASQAHARQLSVGLKNDLDQIPSLVCSFDWALNEECLSYDECGALKPFLDANKAVFHVEYVDMSTQGPAKQVEVCGDASIEGFSTLIKAWDLDPWQLACP